MKVILNEDVYNLGEEGDVKTVKSGYARNFLIPRGLAVPFTKGNAKIFEARKDIIEKKKEEKRKAAMGQKEKIEALEISIPMPAGENGRLFGSVNNAMISDYLAKNGIQMERKKIELTEHNIKTVGKFTAKIKLYDNEAAQLSFTIVNEKGESVVAATKDEKKEVAAEKETPVEDTVNETAVTEEEVVDETAEETVEEIPVVEETVEEIAPVDDDDESEEESATEEKA